MKPIRVRWLRPARYGKTSLPAKFSHQGDDWIDRAWSVTIHVERGLPRRGQVEFLNPLGAPRWLRGGAKFTLYEGEAPVAECEVMTWAERFLRKIRVIEENDRLVMIRSWMPSPGCWPDRPGIDWPVMLLDRGGLRETNTPLWDWGRIKHLWKYGLEGAEPISAYVPEPCPDWPRVM